MAVELAIIFLEVMVDGYSLIALQTITRFSGRLSLFLFSAIFLLHNKPATITAWLSPKFYLLFAIVHGIHLMELLAFVYSAGIQLNPYRTAGGFFAYLYIFAMPIFQSMTAQGNLTERRFYILETVFLYYVWLMFFLTYLPRVQGKMPQAGGTFAEHVALLGWISTMMGMKLSSLIQFPRKRK